MARKKALAKEAQIQDKHDLEFKRNYFLNLVPSISIFDELEEECVHKNFLYAKSPEGEIKPSKRFFYINALDANLGSIPPIKTNYQRGFFKIVVNKKDSQKWTDTEIKTLSFLEKKGRGESDDLENYSYVFYSSADNLSYNDLDGEENKILQIYFAAWKHVEDGPISFSIKNEFPGVETIMGVEF